MHHKKLSNYKRPLPRAKVSTTNALSICNKVIICSPSGGFKILPADASFQNFQNAPILSASQIIKLLEAN